MQTEAGDGRWPRASLAGVHLDTRIPTWAFVNDIRTVVDPTALPPTSESTSIVTLGIAQNRLKPSYIMPGPLIDPIVN